MARIPQLEFANVIIRFGEDLEMIDLFEQIVLPAFKRQDLVRSSRGSDYFFHDIALEQLDESDAGSLSIIGRFVKDTTLVVEQVFDKKNKRLVATDRNVPSAPSALFAFRIRDHKLLWLHEKVGAPSLSMFEATIRAFLRATHEDFVKAEYARSEQNAKTNGEQMPVFKDVQKKYPLPTVEVVSMAAKTNLEEFVKQFSLLQSITIEFLIPNAELDNNPIFKGIRKQQVDIGSKTTKLSHSNSVNGLNKGAAVSQLTPAAQEANSRIKLIGKDQQGDKLSGNEHNFKVSVPMPDLDGNVAKAVRVMNTTLQGLVESGTMALGQLSEQVKDKALKVIQRLRDRHG